MRLTNQSGLADTNNTPPTPLTFPILFLGKGSDQLAHSHEKIIQYFYLPLQLNYFLRDTIKFLPLHLIKVSATYLNLLFKFTKDLKVSPEFQI